AQPGRALCSGRRGRRFESSHSDHRSLKRELVLVIREHLLALCLRQVIRVTDRVYSSAAGPMKLIFPSAGPTDRCQAKDPDPSALLLLTRRHSTSTCTRPPG